MRVLTSPWRWFLRLLPDGMAMPLRRLSWRVVRRLGKVGAAVLPRRRGTSRVDLVLFAWGVDAGGLRAAAEATGVEPNQLLVVTDCAEFSALHRAGIAVEYVPSGVDRERRGQHLLESYPHKRVEGPAG